MCIALFVVIQSWLVPALQTPPVSDEQALETTIRALHQTYLRALLAGDVDAYSAMFTEDATLIFPGEFVKGRGKLERRQQQIFDQIEVLDGSIHTLSVDASGDIAYEVGRFQYSIAGKSDGRKVHLTGRFLAIWKKQTDGSWLLAVDSGFPDPDNH